MGYRHFDRIQRDKVNFPFGHGLSYSTFEYSDLKIGAMAPDNFSVLLDVRNSGELYGGTLIQIYAGFAEPNSSHPLKAPRRIRKG